MLQTDQYRWLSNYGSVPAELPVTTGSILEAFQEVVQRDPDTTLVRYFDVPLSASTIDEISDGLAVAMQQRGIQPGDRIGMYLQNVPQSMIALLSAWKAGAVIVPCNPMFKGRELVKILTNSGARGIILHDDLYGEIAAEVLGETAVELVITTSGLDFLPEGEVPANLAGTQKQLFAGTEDLLELAEAHRGQKPEPVELTSDDVAFMVYTSGTTGAPKGAMNTHGNGYFAANLYREWMKIDTDSVILGLAPLFHVTGLTGHLVLSMITGAQLLLFYRFDADIACSLTEKYRADFAVTAITAFTALLGSDAIKQYDMTSLKTVYSGGAPIPTTVIDQWKDSVGSTIHPMYGLTEVTSPATMTPLGAGYRSDPEMGVVSIGVPLPNTRIRIITDQGEEADARQIGELRITGPQVVPGYWQMPEETAETFEDGELRTGDIGFMDEDGWVYLVDRAKDMIVASGFKVWPSEVEEVLYQHPAVREAGVIGVPDPYRGETVKAYVSLKPGVEATPEEIKAFARDRMAAYKYPRVVEILDDLPKTTSGKIMRRMLQSLLETAAEPTQTSAQEVGVDYPEVRAALEVRTVLEIGSSWLRLTPSGIDPREAARLYEHLDAVLAALDESRATPDRDAFLEANERFHEAVIDLLGNDHLSDGFRSLDMVSLLRRALEGEETLTEDFVTTMEQLADTISAGNAQGARAAILARSKSTREQIKDSLQATERDSSTTGWSSASLLGTGGSESVERRSFADDVAALMQALEARAAIEIGVTQLLIAADTSLPDRSRLVARLKAAIPLVRGSDSAHAARYTRSDDAFHRIIVGLLENEQLVELYNRIDVPEALFRVLESAPIAVRDALDDYQALTAALLEDEADSACHAIASHMQKVRTTLTQAIASNSEKRQASQV